MFDEINPKLVYTTEETREFLKISESTIKRLLKKGVIKAHKVGGQYRIMGVEILKQVSPEIEDRVYGFYRKVKNKSKKTIEKW